MASITIRKLSNETKERLRARAERHGSSLEGLVRSILDQAAQDLVPASKSRFPRDLINIVEPGDDIEPFIREHDERQEPVEL
ncbi:MAG: hypothetical protein HOI95_10735 [Chromatiales bacterium]|jgi:plasmid stability protein|nr:hypothetical protein [Chromatiales bacterium]